METPQNSEKHIYFYSEIFIRLVCCIFLFAFVDSFLQFKYLIGENGIAPIGEFLNSAYHLFGNVALFKFPGLFWISSSNTFISTVFITASLASVLGFLGVYSSLNLFIAGICWLSVVNSGSDFFIYIWDTFLLEAGFIALLVSLLNHNAAHFKLIKYVLYFFIFRLWFSMGIVTLLYNTTIGINSSFMKFFFQNQPMPTNIAFFMYHLPQKIHGVLSIVLLSVEILFPFLIFIKRFRFIAFIVFCLFSISIEICGNYAWFNILTIVICVPLLIETKTGGKLFFKFSRLPLKRISSKIRFNERLARFLTYYQIMLQAILLALLFFPIGNRYLNFLNYYTARPEFISWKDKSLPGKILAFPLQLGSDFKLANPYGVFKGIPVKRWELEFELYNDTVNGKSVPLPYFYKPGLSNNGSFFAPHFPRLEQQLFYESQQGSFYRHYTVYENKFNNLCWTNGLLRNIKKNADYTVCHDTFFPSSYAFVKLTMKDVAFNTWENYRQTGKIWTKKTVFSFFIPNNSINCPLVPDHYFESYKKHIP